MPADNFKELYEKNHATFEKVRKEVYAQVMGHDSVLDEGDDENLPRLNMQKAYVTYATISSSAKSNAEKV